MIDTKALRSRILDLAIQGKLTEQLEGDGTAEDLYQQIQAEKQKLQNLFFHHNRNIHFENRPVMLVLDEFVQLLEKADKRVDYYVLNFSDTLDTSTKTVAVNAKDIRGTLKKQRVPIYHYCGADLSQVSQFCL